MFCEPNSVKTLSSLPGHYVLNGLQQHMQIWVPPVIHSYSTVSSIVFPDLTFHAPEMKQFAQHLVPH
jgi:hypothetical protein